MKKPNEIDANDLLSSLSTSLVLVDQQLNIQAVNLAAQDFFEHSENQLIGQNLFRFLGQQSAQQWRDAEQHIKQSEPYYIKDMPTRLRDGRHAQVDLNVTPIHYKKNKWVVLEMKQIDQQKRIDQEFQQSAQLKASRELIRSLAHEIKNPLGGIRGAAQLLNIELEGISISSHREFTQLIIEQSDRLTNLVDRLLGPNDLPSFKQINIHRVLEKVRLLVTSDMAHQVHMARDYDPSIPDLLIDEDMIQQALLNIIRNAIQELKHQDDAEIRLITRIKSRMTIQGKRHPLCVQIKIVDNGPGIDDAVKDTLFYPMVTNKKSGSGLGLSISQNLINHHNGKIDVESWPGHTEFILSLPITSGQPQ
jgi:two-component system nitrogen regulation sensor histidine kinase GlnL